MSIKLAATAETKPNQPNQPTELPQYDESELTMQHDVQEDDFADVIDNEDQIVDEQQQDQVEEVQEEPQGYQKKNFARLREEKEKLAEENARIARENDEYRRQVMAHEQYLRQLAQQQQLQTQQVPQEQPIYSTYKSDDIPEWKAVKGYADNQYQQSQKELAEVKQQLAAMALERRVLAEYPDWYKVCNQSAVTKLEQAYPHIAASLRSSQDEYAKAASTYTLLKQLGIAQEEPFDALNNKQFTQNKTRPRSSAGVAQTQSPLSQASKFSDYDNMTEAQKRALYRETLEASKRS